jgi:hypothetical protein
MLDREQKSYYASADKALFFNLVKRALALPKGQRIEAIDRAFGTLSTDEAIRRKIDELYAGTQVFEPAQRATMLGESPVQLQARHDAMIDLGSGLAQEMSSMLDRLNRWDGAVARLRPIWRTAVIAHAGKPVAPDANSTLRVSFAHVTGYSPRDGLFATPQTTLSGVVEKHTGEEPFDVPDPVLAAAKEKRYGRWADPELGDVPVDFLADTDTTGGNSGSPVVNGRGELVGVNFDRVWENVANDFGFNPDVARGITVDIRYLLWILDQIEHADGLLQEMGVKK